MNTKNLAIATAVGVLALAGLLLAFPAMAATTGGASPQLPNINSNGPLPHGQPVKIVLQSGQTYTLTSVAGGYRVLGNPALNGTATGSMTIKVTGTFNAGYSVSVTGGQISANGTTYTITGGSAEVGRYGIYMVGQGQAGTAQFLFQGTNLGKFGSADYGILRLDLSNGSGQLGVRLLVSISAAQ
jgi:hypothetical protein